MPSAMNAVLINIIYAAYNFSVVLPHFYFYSLFADGPVQDIKSKNICLA